MTQVIECPLKALKTQCFDEKYQSTTTYQKKLPFFIKPTPFFANR